MRLRDSLTGAALVAAMLLASPAMGQVNPQPQQQSPIATAAKAIQTAQMNLRIAQVAVQRARDKVKNELMRKPEWSPVAADLAKAQADERAAKRQAIDVLHNKPEYQAMVKQRKDADAIRQRATLPRTPGDEDTHVSDDALGQAEDSYTKASLAMLKMESQTLADDSAYNDAKARVDAANARLAQLDAEVDEALKGDPTYGPLEQAATAAQQQVVSARQGLVQARQAAAQQHKSQPPPPRRPSAQGGS